MDPLLFYKNLADDTRLRSLLLILHEQELCVCELMQCLDLSQPKVSRHLAQLRKAGLLIDNRQGQWVFYQINPVLPAWALTVLTQTAQENHGFINPNIQKLLAMGDRPERKSQCC